MKKKLPLALLVPLIVVVLTALTLIVFAVKSSRSPGLSIAGLSMNEAPKEQDRNWLWDHFQASKAVGSAGHGTGDQGATPAGAGQATQPGGGTADAGAPSGVSQASGGGKEGDSCTNPPPTCPQHAFQECVNNTWRCISENAAPSTNAPR